MEPEEEQEKREYWDSGTLGHWDSGTVEQWDTGIVGH